MDDEGYIDFLSQEDPSSTVSGNLPGHSNQNHAFLGQNNRSYPTRNHNHRQSYHTMAAMPRSSTRPTRSTRPEFETRHDYFANEQPVITPFKWNSIDIPIPKLAPTTETPHIKITIFKRLVDNIRKADTKWINKADLLAHIFQTIAPAAGTQADIALADLGDYTSPVFEVADAELLDINLSPINVNLNNPLAANTRTRTKWIRLGLTLRPRNTTVGAIILDPNLFPSAAIIPVYLKAYRTNNSLHPNITHDVLRDSPETLIEIYFNNGAEFEFAQINRYTSNPDIDLHDKWLREMKAKTKYEAMTQIIQPVYVGELEGTETVTKRFYKLNQRQYSDATRTYEFITVEQLNQQFQGLIQEIDGTNPPNDCPHLSHTFYQALTKNLQERSVRDLPAANPNNFNHNLAQLNKFVIEVIRHEKELKSFVNIARRAAAPPNRSARNPTRPTAQAFLGTFPDDNEEEHHTSQHYDEEAIPHDNSYIEDEGDHIVIPTTFMAAPREDNQTKQLKTALRNTLTALSLAEQALRDASGTKFPPQCFGCSGITDYEDKCQHLFKDCPFKQDPRVTDNFKKNLQDFRDRRNNQRNRTWRQDGYPNKTMATIVKKIADPDTTDNQRLTLLTDLHTEMGDAGIGTERQEKKRPAESTATYTTNSKKKPTRRMGLNFFTYAREKAVKTIKTAGTTFFGQPKEKYAFHITTTLPFLLLPIGTGEDKSNEANLSGLLDSGGCCNMGWLDYHQKIFEKYPQLVADFTDLADKQYETFDIGGIKDSIEITHMVKYWLPYQDNGAMATVTIGLSPDMPLDTLYGLPFQINAQMTADFANQKVTSKIFGTEYDMQMKRPERSPLESLDYPATKTPKVLLNNARGSRREE
jgi:hypothetical protein